ncbi:hypothetical protein JCM10449v2_005648 [Rhodotorula kratochvilovae]
MDRIEVTPPKGTSLLDLPDELISRIFELAERLAKFPVDMLVINKRLHRLILPIWYHTLDFPDAWVNMDEFYAHLIEDEHHRAHTRHIIFAYDRGLPNVQMSLLGKFAQLRAIEITVESEGDDRDVADDRLCSLLRSLPYLHKLCYDDERIPPRSAPFDDLDLLGDTSVTRLQVTTVETVLALLGSQGHRNTRRLEELVVVEGSRSPSFLRSTLPWLVSDRLVFRKNFGLPILEGIIDELKRLNRESPLLPLKYLELKMYGSTRLLSRDVRPVATQYWSGLSQLLPLVTPRHLCLSNVRGLPAIEDSAETFFSVEVLEVATNGLHIERSSDHDRLCCLIDVFPSLTHLDLHDVYLDHEEEANDGMYDFCTLNSRRFRSQHPVFASFIAHIKDTRIVSFRLFQDTYALVCWRATAREDFKADMITL